ncbi:class IV aminotransferase [Alcanivorax sp. S71-1-4]|uniref:aminotransferase class IV n=1 Tax=Alcanivorax sp. S71-1-4 TaxID=1177159 RepID=UPI0016B519AF|nr:aminotransferase class IV [Alcanivorax sp. S71-1-4]KAF0809257.1 class IV aminotransferase [Alcanivorax sp. S71-1-4]
MAPLKGLWEPYLAADDRGLAYGDGCFETLRLGPAGAPLWPWHRRRLLAGAAALAIPLTDDTLDEALRQALARCSGAAVLKLILTRGSGGRGYAGPSRASHVCWPVCTRCRCVPQPTTATGWPLAFANCAWHSSRRWRA